MARILCVGIATLDIVNRVASYPPEDSEVRALAQQQRMGGNAANTAIVLAQLGSDTHWVGNLSEQAQIVHQTFASHGVDAAQAVTLPGVMPTSYIMLSEATGSRSIVHYRELPEYAAEDFLKLDLRGFDWVHFEGRALDQLPPMIERARGMCGLPVSLEVEKPRDGIEALFEEADILFFSRDYAQARGHASAVELLQSLPRACMATCTWGAEGVWAVDFEGEILHQPAHRPAALVDTLGAGDVFNAGMLHGLSQGLPMAEAMRRANRLAGEQCGREGLEVPAAS